MASQSLNEARGIRRACAGSSAAGSSATIAATDSPEGWGWGLSAFSGQLRHGGESRAWVGTPRNRHSGAAVTGDVISLELNCDTGVLAVCLNGRWLGAMVEDLPTREPLVWCAELYYGGDTVACLTPGDGDGGGSEGGSVFKRLAERQDQ